MLLPVWAGEVHQSQPSTVREKKTNNQTAKSFDMLLQPFLHYAL